MNEATGTCTAEIGVIGGSGLYEFLTDAVQIEVDTPFGRPSDPIVVGAVMGRQVAFVPRHGADHRWPPHRIPYRANLWALRSLGVGQILAPCAVGTLCHDRPIGSLVIPDQVIDRTSGRASTYFDGPPAGVVHVSFADPYCPTGRAAVSERGAGSWLGALHRGHPRGDRGPALLQPRGVALVCRSRARRSSG